MDLEFQRYRGLVVEVDPLSDSPEIPFEASVPPGIGLIIGDCLQICGLHGITSCGNWSPLRGVFRQTNINSRFLGTQTRFRRESSSI